MTGAEVTGAEIVWGRGVLGPRWFGAAVTVNHSLELRFHWQLKDMIMYYISRILF